MKEIYTKGSRNKLRNKNFVFFLKTQTHTLKIYKITKKSYYATFLMKSKNY